MRISNLCTSLCGIGFVCLLFSSNVDAETRLTLTSVKKAENSGNTVTPFGITREDAARIAKTIPNVSLTIPVREAEYQARKADRRATARVIGTTREFARVRSIQMGKGRFLIPADSQRRENVVVIGNRLAQRLFPKENAIGQSLRIDNDLFRIVGQLKPPKTFAEKNLQDAVITPIATMRARFGDTHVKRASGAFSAEQFELSRLEVVLEDPELRVQTQQALEALLQRTHPEEDYRIQMVAARLLAAPPAKPVAQNVPSILAPGVLESASVVEIRNQLPGESSVLKVVKEGTRVKKGDLLLELSNNALREKTETLKVELVTAEQGVASAELQLNSAKVESDSGLLISQLQFEAAELEKTQYFGPKGELSVEVAALKREVKASEQAVQLLSAAIEATQRRIKQGGSAEASLADLTLKLTKARTARENAEDALQLLNGPTSALRMKMHELKIATAKSELDRQKLVGKNLVAQAAANVAAVKSQLKFASEKYRRSADALAAAKVVSPIDGVVVYNAGSARRTSSGGTISVGATVRERQSLLKVTDLKKMQVRVRIHESKVRQVRVGQACTLVFDALPNESVAGVVKSVANIPVPAAFPRTNIKEYEVVVSLKKQLDQLRLGMTCEVSIKGQ